MGHMVVDLMVGTRLIGMERKEMEGSWTRHIGEVMEIGSILVLVLTSTMVIIIIILTEGVIGDIFQMRTRRLSHLALVEF